MPLLILFAMLMLPVAEIATFIAVSDRIGWFNAFLLLLASALFGMFLIRTQSVVTTERMIKAMREGKPPERHLVDGAMASMAGILFIIPGFLTDILAFAILLPFTRRLLWLALSYGVRATWGEGAIRAQAWRQKPGRQDRPVNEPPPKSRPQKRDDVIDAEFTEVKPEPGEKPAQATPQKGKESPWNKEG